MLPMTQNGEPCERFEANNLEIFNNFCVVRNYQLLENENNSLILHSLFDSFFNQPPIYGITCEETENHPYLHHEPETG